MTTFARRLCCGALRSRVPNGTRTATPMLCWLPTPAAPVSSRRRSINSGESRRDARTRSSCDRARSTFNAASTSSGCGTSRASRGRSPGSGSGSDETAGGHHRAPGCRAAAAQRIGVQRLVGPALELRKIAPGFSAWIDAAGAVRPNAPLDLALRLRLARLAQIHVESHRRR